MEFNVFWLCNTIPGLDVTKENGAVTKYLNALARNDTNWNDMSAELSITTKMSC